METLEQLSDSIEREALISLYTHCPKDLRNALGLTMVEVTDALVVSARGLPGILINRTLGLGSSRALQPPQLLHEPGQEQAFQKAVLKEIIDVYRRQGIERYFVHLYADRLSGQNRADLMAFGLGPARAWMKFYRPASACARPATELRIEAIGTERSRDFARLVCQGFGIAEAGVPLIAALAQDPRWHLFLSFSADRPAGAGALFVQGHCGWLDWATTAPEFRQRGSQSAIMAARINLARELGCQHLFTETGEAVPGDPQHSYGNILKAGFAPLRARANYAPVRR